jgi:class 3 adenylate cyclase
MARAEHLTVMFTDLVGFTERTSRQSRAQTESMLRDHERLVRPIVGRFSGRVVKMIGDACLATFRSPTDGLRCAMALQDAIVDYNKSHSAEEHMRLRVALNAGEVQVVDKDVYGEAVNAAARVEGLTPPDEIYFTEAVYLAMNKAEVKSEAVGVRELKGIPNPVTLHRVVPPESPEPKDAADADLPYGGMHRPEKKAVSFPGLSPKVLVAAGMLVLVAAVGIWIVFAHQSSALMEKAQSAMAKKQWDTVLKLSQTALSESADNPEAIMLQGHVAAERHQWAEAVAAYKKALGLDPELQHKERLVDNLVGALGHARAPATELLVQYPSAEAVAALKQRISRSGYWARQSAVRILTKMGRGAEIDPLAVAIDDLKDGPKCSQRLDAVKRLRKLKDKRALPALKAAMGGSLTDRLKNTCLWVEAEATIRDLE